MKGKKNKKEEDREKSPQPQVCYVCRLSRWDTEDFQQLKCISCNSTVHKNCYYPDIQNKDKARFKCDPCKKKTPKNKDKQYQNLSCSHCGSSSEMLKDVGLNEWMHVLCALTSPRTTIQSYLNLSFVVKPSSKNINKLKKCVYCDMEKRKEIKGQGLLCSIQNCKTYLHLTCVVDYAGLTEENQAASTIGLLDQNEGSLLYWLKNKQQKNKFSGLSIIAKEIKEPKYLVCKPHNEDGSFQWCICKSNNESNELIDWVQCQSCSRWYHPQCTDKDVKEKGCRGCKDKDIYVKNLKLPELLSQAAKTQRLAHLDKASIKFLNHFCFKPSEHLEKMFVDKKNQFQIERYFLRQFLEEYWGKEKNEKDEEKVLEVLYYLLKRQYKKQSEISSEDMEEMEVQLSGKGTKFEWSQEKSEKVEKKYKDFISNKLKRIKRDSMRDIRMKLNQFIEFNKEKQRSIKEISESLYPIFQLMNQSDFWNKIQENTDVKDHHHLLQFFTDSNLSEKDITRVLEGIKILLSAKTNNRTLNEDQYHSIVLRKYDHLSQTKEKELKTIFMNLSKGIKPKRLFQEKKDKLTNIENKFVQCKPEDKVSLRNSAIKNGLFLSSSSKMFRIEVDSIEADICKKQFLKNYNPPQPNEIGNALDSLMKLNILDKKSGIFNKQERQMFKDIYNKYNFYHSLMIHVRAYKQFTVQDPQQLLEDAEQKIEENGSHRLQRRYTQQRLEQKLEETLNQWPMTPEHAINALSVLRQTAKNQIKWTDNESEIINTFFDKIVFRIQMMVQEGLCTIQSSLLMQIKQISKYLRVQDKYIRYNQLCIFYEQWKQDLESKFKNVEFVLESNDLCQELKEVIQAKMSQIGHLSHRIDLSAEMKKLKILKVWIIFSQKFLGNERLTTIAAIQSAKSLMDKIQYPKNSIRKDIERLEKQGRSLNKRISRFLEKHKLVDMELYEELRFIQNKMTLKEAHELQRDLQNSELDVEIELNELKEQIQNALTFTNDIDMSCKQASTSQTLLKLRKDLLQCPFNVCTSSQYETLLHNYYSLRCQQYDGPLSKKEYFRLLNHGGTSSISLLNKTQYLLNTYRDIQTAQKETLNSKPKQELLLSQDMERYRNDLGNDPAQLSKIQKYITQFQKYKNQFASYKIERADVQKYNQLQNQISRLPVCSQDIKGEINRMKRQLDELVNKTKNYMPENANKNTHYVSPFTNTMVSKYQSLGMRCSTLDKFQELVIKSQDIEEMNHNISVENYKLFSLKCASVPELMDNDEYYRQRELAFQRMCQYYLQSSDPHIEVSLTLLYQGGYLIRRPKNTERLLSVLMKIHCKSYKWERAQMEDMNRPRSQREDDEESDSFGDYNDDDDLDDQSLEDFQGDDFNSNVNLISDEEEQVRDEESLRQSSKKKEEKSRKRPRPKGNECVISDDD